MERVLHLLTAWGGVASASQFAGAGVTRRALGAALESGAVERLRRGWFALATLPVDERRAVALGGVLTCASALAARGLWVLESERLHVAVPPHASERSAPPGVVLHWRSWDGCGHESGSLDGLRASLLHLLACVPPEDALMTLDSAVNSGAISLDDLLALKALAPTTRGWVLGEVDGGCQSGSETRVRRLGQRLRVVVRTQVEIERVGHVDVVFGERLVLETDGRTFHSGSAQIEEDYRRSLELAAQGYLCIRLSTKQVLQTWGRTETVIRALVDRREHLWGVRR
ncbi:DUF559 domain-containing protein [Rathayibacter sp. VKM Ac-2803]|uniref:type IV toxin-antitoxin system AbiEi family antitoxin domain-containing protein n=1 Tax=unclassified Rathayibacter TaxID=2609250 RepID=UPI00135893A2|nr:MULTISPECIES: type IV toxin-antitoxin system AbiEi family antitoxin domain-containing protein [unclassified Rathayibacter]MWV47729.1 DUF559 domain-containing protein [Rathayibacter sp. VKM Ac-2803]MWV59060.1 DUF559 domain-containing protein [Rathayibacter sp. VKM Ac-2754]